MRALRMSGNILHCFRERRQLAERFYSYGSEGELTARDGAGGRKRRLLEPRAVLSKLIVDSPRGADSASSRIAVTLLADALGDEQRALQTQEYFCNRVMSLLPARWTMTRSRVHAYVELMEPAKRANLLDDAKARSQAFHLPIATASLTNQHGER